MCLSPRGSSLLGAAALAAALATPAPSAAQADATSLVRLTYVEKGVERGAGSWADAVEGSGFDLGEGVRTGPEGIARLELPWMALSLGPGSEVRFPDEYLLSVVLEKGRAVLEAETRDALKLVTPEARVRGQGRAIVRREGQRTLVTCIEGHFEVAGRGRVVSLGPGRGTVVSSGRAPTAAEDTAPPPNEEGLWPGLDPVYAERDEPLGLLWEGEAPAYTVEILPVGSDYVLLQRDVGPPPAQLSIPWGGSFRWRVASRDDRGLEGLPSAEGLICVSLLK